jgi:hypothetical protein
MRGDYYLWQSDLGAAIAAALETPAPDRASHASTTA